MPASTNLRTSVTLTPQLAGQLRRLARREKTSMNRVVVELIEKGLEARERERARFFELAERLTESTDVGEREKLKEELAKMTFGE